ncbi:MAG: extracellular solute-binding protein [Rubrivivax sp.]
MLTNGEVVMGSLWSTRVHAAMAEGAPLGIAWNQNAILVQSYGIPAGTKNVEAARKYIDYASSPEVQSRWLSKYKAIPVNVKSYGAASKDLMDLSTGTVDQVQGLHARHRMVGQQPNQGERRLV